MTRRTEDDAGASSTSAALSVLVVRSGGFTGIRQQWEVEPDGDRDEWLALIVACPWDASPTRSLARDAFVWRIEARMPPTTRVASVADEALVGPWRELVDRVQHAAPSGGAARG